MLEFSGKVQNFPKIFRSLPSRQFNLKKCPARFARIKLKHVHSRQFNFIFGFPSSLRSHLLIAWLFLYPTYEHLHIWLILYGDTFRYLIGPITSPFRNRCLSLLMCRPSFISGYLYTHRQKLSIHHIFFGDTCCGSCRTDYVGNGNQILWILL